MSVCAQVILQKYKNQQSACHAQRKPKNIQKRIGAVDHQISQGNPEVVFYMANFGIKLSVSRQCRTYYSPVNHLERRMRIM
jgi:hypothetical protein